MGIALKDFKTKESYFKLIDKALFSYLYEGIYKPMFEILNIKPELKARNDVNVVIEALEKGKIFYYEGGFKAQTKFNNAISRELEKWGAKWDNWEKVWKIPLEQIPDSVRVALAESKIQAENKIKLLDDYLKEIQANMPDIIDSWIFNEEVITILDDAGREIKKTVKHLNVIEPEFTPEQKRQIANNYTNAIKQYAIKDFDDDRIPKMREKIAEFALQGYRLDKVEELLQKEFGIMKRKAEFLARNETAILLAEVKKEMYKEMGFTKFIWRCIGDSRTRDLHRHLNGTTWSYDNPPIIDERTGQRGLPGQTYNCLVGEMNIISPFLYNRIFKRKFTGEMTELILPMGRLKITPNHPILTARGWVAAKDINIGDNIAKISDKTFLTTGIKPKNIEITIEEFFSFYSVLFNTQRVSHTDFDFHGDISIDKQVDIVNIKDKLGAYFKPNFNQFRLEQIFTKAYKFGIYTPSNRAFYQAFPICTLAPNSFIGRFSKVFSFFFCREFHTVEHSLRAVAWLNTLLNESTGYDLTRDAIFLSQLFNAPAGSVKFYQLILWDICFNCFRKDIIPLLFHGDREMSGTTSETLSDLSKTKPAFIEFDTVLDKVNSISSNIHIYNLENSNHWYLTSNYITKNCRCTAIPYTDNDIFTHKNQVKTADSKARINKYLRGQGSSFNWQGKIV